MRRLLLLLSLPLLALLGPWAGPADASTSAETLRQAEALLGVGSSSSSAGRGSGREATVILRDLSRELPRLSPSQRLRARRLLQRPSQSGDEAYFGPEDPASPICDTNFCVHWGTARRDRPPKADSEPNGIPDYVEAVLAAGQRSFEVENGELGWQRGRSDGNRGARGGRGGNGQVDIYLAGLKRGLFGYATSDPGAGGPRRPAYLVIDNDFSGFGGSPLELMRVTIAHEYNHVLQFGYDAFEDAWMFESTATWVEDRVYPAINDYFNFLQPFYENPDVPLAETNRRSVKVYGSAMWNHWLDSRLGPATIRDAWALSRGVRPGGLAVAAYEAGIDANGGRSFSKEFAGFAAATAELNSAGAFPDAGSYLDVKRSGKLSFRSRKFKLDHTAYRLYRVRRGGDVRLIARIKRGTRSAVALVGRTGSGPGGTVTVALEYLRRGGRASVQLPDAGSYDRVTAAVINADGRVNRGRRYRADGRSFKVKIR